MAEAKRDHDAQLGDDEAYPPAIGPGSPLPPDAQTSDSSESEEADEDKERSKTSQRVKEAAN